MNKYVYPAIFEPNELGGFNVCFPDLPAATQGKSIEDAIAMGRDSLELLLYTYEEEGIQAPEPTPISDITVEPGQFVSLIDADTLEYRKMFNNRSVKKTLSIPEWLNEAAVKENVNFSQVLQEALKDRLSLA